jgi:hypothetical protein
MEMKENKGLNGDKRRIKEIEVKVEKDEEIEKGENDILI